MELGDKPKNPDRRNFLKTAAAAAVVGLGAGPVMKAFEGPDATQDKKNLELPEDMKERNTVLEIEKKILEELEKSPGDLENISKGIIPEKVFEHSKKYRKGILAAGGTALASVALGAAALTSEKREGGSGAVHDVTGGVAGAVAVLGMLSTADILLSQPKKEHVDIAENFVLEWINEFKMKEGIQTIESTRQSIREQINQLTERQKENTRKSVLSNRG